MWYIDFTSMGPRNPKGHPAFLGILTFPMKRPVYTGPGHHHTSSDVRFQFHDPPNSGTFMESSCTQVLCNKCFCENIAPYLAKVYFSCMMKCIGTVLQKTNACFYVASRSNFNKLERSEVNIRRKGVEGKTRLLCALMSPNSRSYSGKNSGRWKK